MRKFDILHAERDLTGWVEMYKRFPSQKASTPYERQMHYKYTKLKKLSPSLIKNLKQLILQYQIHCVYKIVLSFVKVNNKLPSKCKDQDLYRMLQQIKTHNRKLYTYILNSLPCLPTNARRLQEITTFIENKKRAPSVKNLDKYEKSLANYVAYRLSRYRDIGLLRHMNKCLENIHSEDA